MVLRLRPDLPQVVADPMIAHRAAEYEYRRALTGHIAYDFAMDSEDHSTLYCSEVASEAFEHVGVNLWQFESRISGQGTRSWLAAFGVRHWQTQEPSDLEYDPQLIVVAEWRDYETLKQDRADNAVVDVMLESAENGERLDYDLHALPMARVAKLYSVVLNQWGEVGPVPEGMDATSALRNEWFSARHREIRDRLDSLADDFAGQRGYSAPYWELIRLARRASSYQ
jgi:hypothetical protein